MHIYARVGAYKAHRVYSGSLEQSSLSAQKEIMKGGGEGGGHKCASHKATRGGERWGSVVAGVGVDKAPPTHPRQAIYSIATVSHLPQTQTFTVVPMTALYIFPADFFL